MIRTSFNILLSISIAGLSMSACSSGEAKKEEAKEEKTSFLDREFSSTEKRKVAFFQKLLPMVEKENERILAERKTVRKALKNKELSSKEERHIKELARKYRVAPKIALEKEGLKQLERKTGAIPPRLALIQAANESSWGNSRFAKQGNNLFGQWCFRKGCGIVPKRRSAGATHEVASFSSIDQSVQAYMRNLNSHPAYKPLRDIRQKSLDEGKELSAHDMAGGLRSYAGIGDEYIRILREMMKSNEELLQKAGA